MTEDTRTNEEKYEAGRARARAEAEKRANRPQLTGNRLNVPVEGPLPFLPTKGADK